jgi:F0F1-type ATP synthase membrane subunit b/b'
MKEESLMKKLDYAIRENQQQRASYEQKIANLKNKSSQEIQNVRTLADDRRKADTRNFKQEFSNLQTQMQQELLRIKGQFQKQLGDSKTASDLQLAKLTQRYEGLLARERTESQRTLNAKMSSARAEYDRLYKKSELEKATMKNQFDIQMQNVKQSIADREIERAKDANKNA